MAGWDDLEAAAPKDARSVSDARDDLDRLTFRVFSNEDGKKLTEWLRAVYLEQPVAVPGSEPAHAFYREGQNSVVRDIEARMKRAINQGNI
jgi:hypothetical protein